jgi:hypothetical protein
MITADDTDWYYGDVGSGDEEQIVATVERGHLLLCLVDEYTGSETGVLAIPEQPAILLVPHGRYRMSVRVTATTVYEIFRLPVHPIDAARPSRSAVGGGDGSTTARWPEREVPELIRSASGVVGRRWGLDSRSYELNVAVGYRAELTVQCHSGAFEAFAITASGKIVPLILPHDDRETAVLKAGKYLVYLIAHAHESEYSLDVEIKRAASPGVR